MNMDMNTNLLEETIEELTDNGKSLSDVVWFGTSETRIIGDLKDLLNFVYYPRHYCSDVPFNFIIVGDDWWLERESHNGADWWEFKTVPNIPNNTTSSLNNLKELKK